MDLDIYKAEQEIAALQAKVKAEKERLAKMTPDQADAEVLHKATCHFNHTDGCGWYYESWEKTRGQFSEHLAYLRRVRELKAELPEGMDIHEAIRIYKIVGKR